MTSDAVSRPLTAGTDAFPAPEPRRGRADELVHESRCYRVSDGHRPLFLDLHVPRPHASGTTAPLIVWVHGGGWVAGSRRRFPVGIEKAHLLERTLVAGFAVARIDYRLLAEAPFPSAVEDVIAAVEWLIEHAERLGLDGSRVALWGESAGAHLALLAAAEPALGARLSAVVLARARLREFMARVQPTSSSPVAEVEDLLIETVEHPIGLRIQRPSRPTDVALLYVHGGGWVMGDLDTHQAQTGRIAAALPAVTVQVDYRRAPEHPFPAPLEDVMTAVRWCREHLEELGCSRLVLAGDSAGGHLVLSAALVCRDAGIEIAALLVNYPGTDFRSPAVQGLPLTLLGGRDELRHDPLVSPVLGDLSGLPPTVIGVGALDFLYEDILTFEYRLRAAGTPTRLRIFPTLGHGYFSMAPLSAACDRAAETVCLELASPLWDARS
ncbi:MAG: alpha/beta hydrolase [Nocardioides sp.]|uniref:alpha/beta hydrolase fold domain-containing protein n=1 Tax=Nocardioides sp. TaxID=35761 RepID=UPI0039E7258E